ncbi:MAG: class I SAM-dependent methyltransferase [Mucilaginibacter polytrichastri]|nr:class I SAM-dependent methyltransferase [Mucilaginibacter polytrichastri]
MNEPGTSANVQAAYEDFYKSHDEQWRMLGAKYKARNIRAVCEGKSFARVLEVGAGDGSILKHLSQSNFAAEYHAVEIAQSGVDRILQRGIPNLVSAKVFDGYTLPFADNSFSLVILSHVLEHVEHERRLIREIRRVAPMAVIEVPRDYRYNVDQHIQRFLAYGHINMYTPSSLRYLLRSEGYRIVAHRTSLIKPEVKQFNAYVNGKQRKSVFKNMKFSLEFTVKKNLGDIFGKRVKEKLANAYTVLCEKDKDAVKIF